MSDGVGILPHVRGERHDRVAGSRTNPFDARRGVPLEDGAVLGEGDAARGVFHGLPVGVVGSPFHVVDGLASHLKRDAQLDQCFDLTLPSDDTSPRRGDLLQVARADRGEGHAAGSLDIHHPPAGQDVL